MKAIWKSYLEKSCWWSGCVAWRALRGLLLVRHSGWSRSSHWAQNGAGSHLSPGFLEASQWLRGTEQLWDGPAGEGSTRVKHRRARKETRAQTHAEPNFSSITSVCGHPCFLCAEQGAAGGIRSPGGSPQHCQHKEILLATWHCTDPTENCLHLATQRGACCRRHHRLFCKESQ